MSFLSSRAGSALLLCSLLASSACGGAANAPAAPEDATPPDTSTDAKAESAADTTDTPQDSLAGVARFDDMKPGEKMEYMRKTVLPKMTSVFQESGSEDFVNVTCKTCHGSRAGKGDFKMPNEDILPLDASDGFADEAKAHPKMMKFMAERVVPEMAQLLGEQPYDVQTHKGFGCFGCHTKAD